jgi:hypothetical protein
VVFPFIKVVNNFKAFIDNFEVFSMIVDNFGAFIDNTADLSFDYTSINYFNYY